MVLLDLFSSLDDFYQTLTSSNLKNTFPNLILFFFLLNPNSGY